MEIDIKMDRHFLGISLALMTGVSWGTVSPIGRILALQGINMVTVTVLRTFLVVAGFGLYLALRSPQYLRTSLKEQEIFLIYGILSVVFTYTGFLFSLKYLTVSAALIIHYTFPMVTLLGGLLITKEPPTPAQVLSALLILVGVWVGMFSGKEGTQEISLPGILWGLVAVLGLSGQSLLGRETSKKGELNRNSIIFYSHVWGGLCLIIIKTFTAGWADVSPLSLVNWGYIAIISCVGSLLAYAAFYTALKYISATAASLMCTVEIITGITLAALMSAEFPTLREMAGCTIIILAIVLAAIPPRVFKGRFKGAPRQNNA